MKEVKKLIIAAMELERERAERLSHRLDMGTKSVELRIAYAEASAKWFAYHEVLQAIDGNAEMLRMAATKL